MSVKYAATSDQESLMCFVNGKKTVLKHSRSSKKGKKSNVSLQACSRSTQPLLCRVIVERPRLEKKKKTTTEEINLLLSHC